MAGIPDRPRASSYEPGNQARSVTETNSVVCSYGKYEYVCSYGKYEFKKHNQNGGT